MASITKYVRLSDTPRETDLCPTCFNPSLMRYTLEKFSMEGIDIMGTRVLCVDCKKWTANFEPVAS